MKRILSALACQHAGEFLPMHDKMKVLGSATETRQKSSLPTWDATRKPAVKRIGLISDSRGLASPLDYAIDACKRHSAKLDLLIYGSLDTENLSTLENQLREAGVDYRRIQLGTDHVKDIVGYVSNHPSLIFLLARADDAAAKLLIEKVIPKRGGLVPVPFVLIGGQPPTRSVKQSAA